MDVRARVVPDGSLFRLEILAIHATGGMPQQNVQVDPKTFFSRAEAREYARNNYGLRDAHIS
jgi:hypothetical protein